MGAAQWYERQVDLVQGTVLFPRAKAIKEKAAKTLVVDKLQGLPGTTIRGLGKVTFEKDQGIPTQEIQGLPGTFIEGIGRVTVEKEENVPTNLPTDFVREALLTERKSIQSRLQRGHKLRAKLVNGLGFGILFRRDIW
jgi:hypothetical protein